MSLLSTRSRSLPCAVFGALSLLCFFLYFYPSARANVRHQLCQDDRKFTLVDTLADCTTPSYGFADVLHVFEAHRIEWNIFGRDDPWWSVDTAVQRGSEVPPAVRTRFYESGDEWLSSARSPALPLLQAYGGPRKNALDFGCGLGRLSLTLAGFFDSVTCVDQSIYHLQRAKKETALHSQQRAKKIQFVLSGPNLLSAVTANSYDYVLSLIALQHCVTELQLMYVEQLCDVLKLGGLGYIQIPTFIHQTPGVHCGHLDRWFEKEFEGGMQMHFTSQDTLEAALKSRGCNLIQAEICDMAGGGVTSKCLLYNKTVSGPLVAPEGAL